MLVSVADYERAAREALPQAAWDYYYHGADDEITLQRNRSAFEEIVLRYRVLAGVGDRKLGIEILGQKIAMPAMAAPTAFHKLAHPEGEIATVRGVADTGTGMFLSTLSTVAMEDVVAAAEAPVFFQLYIYRDRELTRDLVARAEAAGCKAIALTVDAIVFGKREPDIRNRFHLPDGMRIENAAPAGYGALDDVGGGSALTSYVNDLMDPTISWDDLAWLVESTSLPVLVKGVVRGDDATRCRDLGAAGVVVSNHGGRQLDTSPATIIALREVVDAVGGDVEVLVDGGVRRGTDILKAIALGAKAVLVGRPILWGLAVDGQTGVAHVLQILRDELDSAMALSGCSSLDDVTPDLVGNI